MKMIALNITTARRGHRTGLAGAVALTLTLAANTLAANSQIMVCDLRGGQEVPPNASTARGCGRFLINTNTNELRYHISFTGLSSAETAAHFHGIADPGINAGVLVGLPSGNPKVGTWTYPEAIENDLLSGRVYVNIHTQMFPGGEIRGQVSDMVAVLDGAQENPPTIPGSAGWGLVDVDTCTNTLKYHIRVESLSAAEIAAHIHGMSLHSVNAGVLHNLPGGPVKTGSWVYPEALEPDLLLGLAYINIHTAAFPGGEIRGQIVNTVVPIDAAQEVPANASSACGCGFISLDPDANLLGYYITFAGLTSPETAAHFHGFSPPGINSGVQFNLGVGGPKKGIWVYPAASETPIFDDLTYINIHTVNFPGGEIRGQVVTPLPQCRGDINCNGVVNVDDLLGVINGWGPCGAPPPPCAGDVTGNGVVNVDDLLGVINAWGKCP